MAELLKIAICEDEIEQRDKLLHLLDESKIKNTYSFFTTGEELLAVFERGKYDLILMDIYMGSELTGIETIKFIREKDRDIPVAFVTTSKDHTLESYRLSAMKYIEKPYSKDCIDDILHLALLKKNDVPALLIQKTVLQKESLLQILFIWSSSFTRLLFVLKVMIRLLFTESFRN